MIDPSDFLAAHPDPTEFLDTEFNDVLPDRVAEATAALLEAKPHLARVVGRHHQIGRSRVCARVRALRRNPSRRPAGPQPYAGA